MTKGPRPPASLAEDIEASARASGTASSMIGARGAGASRTAHAHRSRSTCSQPSALRLRLTTTLLDALFPPFVGTRLRMAGLRAAGLTIGARTLMWDVPTFLGTGDVRRKLTIGSGCGFNVGCLFLLDAPVTIEDEVSCGHDVMFLSRSADGEPSGAEAVSGGIVIGSGSWLGARSVIMSGVTVGAGAVIGAGTIVSKNVPPNTLVSGRQSISLARWR
jgi:maltose O-acetyltransferase